MAVTITWDDGVNTPTAYGVSDEVLGCLEQYRQALVTWNGSANVPKYANIPDMVLGTLTDNLIAVAMNQFPTASVVAAKAVLGQAITDYQATLLAAVRGGIA